MRKLIESTLVSLDGVVEAPERWAPFDDEAKQHALANLRTYDGFVMGRATYESFRAGWSGIHGDPYIDAINASRKYVASNSLTEVTWNAQLLAGDAADEVRRLKEQPGGNLIKYGTGLLDRTLFEHGLIDELQLWIFPIVVGNGRRLFAELGGIRPELALTDVRRLGSGAVILTYAVGQA